MKIFDRLKDRKGITGADVAAAITVIVLTVGIVTAIYVNTMNKSKDNVRYANATRIATNIMENIQKRPYEYLTAICNETYELKGSDSAKAFDTKIPNGFNIKITAKKATGASYDIARDVTVNVTYKANTSYKTITLNSVKEKELMDMTNIPDMSLIPGYNPLSTAMYYYPVVKSGSDYKVTTTNDINWYNYTKGTYALVYATTSGGLNVGATASGGTVYAWIPRFVVKNGTTGISNIEFLYGASDYKISLNQYGDLFAYGVSYSGTINANSVPNNYDSGYGYTSFATNDGLNGVWYQVGGANTNKVGSSNNTVKDISVDFKNKAAYSSPNITIN